MEKEMVSTFMEITACESHEYAVQHLGSCRWNLEEAVNRFFNSGGAAGAGASGVSAPIPSEAEAAMDDDDDDVRAPIPAHVEALYEYDDPYYYGDRIAAIDAPFGGLASYTAPAIPVQPALSEIIQPTGWGEGPEPGNVGQAAARAEDVAAAGKSHDDAAEEQAQDDNSNSNSNEDGGRMVSNEEEDDDNKEQEQSDDDYNMSYDSSDEMDDYGLEMDEDDYASFAEDAEEDQQQPRPAARPRKQQGSLDDMYKLPSDLMFAGPFHFAKVHAATEDRFLLVNLQAQDFQSELYNRDLWSDEQVRGVVKDSLVLFLAQKKKRENMYGLGDECSMVCTFYRLEDNQLPALLVLDPITGMLLKKWSGPMIPEEFPKFVGEYATSKPSTMSKPKFFTSTSAPAAVEPEPAAPTEIIPKPAAEAGEHQEPAAADKSAAPAAEAGSEAAEEPVPVPEAEPPADEMVEDDDEEEPMEGEKMYRMRIRFPDGTMVAKEFGCKRRVASLFKFCRSTVRGRGEAAAEQKAFKIVRFAGGRFEPVQGDGGVTFEDLDLNCATVSVVLDT
ncbi:unnamed protein product [Urochloa decumbens]|uniref:UBX domain-containing protein n=1 Tax=Urochloa decumbens TaxID=240449 RepID=A0ABC9H6M6_9POAL